PTESAIMRQFGVSRTVVREALSRLQASGLVETQLSRSIMIAIFQRQALRNRLRIIPDERSCRYPCPAAASSPQPGARPGREHFRTHPQRRNPSRRQASHRIGHHASVRRQPHGRARGALAIAGLGPC
ncbi:hypothetical protein CTI14_47220, partial [Methylobacterium radiotolerans]